MGWVPVKELPGGKDSEPGKGREKRQKVSGEGKVCPRQEATVVW